jgi:Family of unknown function (DUF5677)
MTDPPGPRLRGFYGRPQWTGSTTPRIRVTLTVERQSGVTLMASRTMEEEASDLSTASRVLYRLGETFREKLLEKPIPATKTPLVFFFARGFMTYQAVIRLWEGGFWQDAAVLSRSLREASYQARWAAKCGDEAAGLFMQDHERNWRKVMRTISETATPDVKSKAQEMTKASHLFSAPGVRNVRRLRERRSAARIPRASWFYPCNSRVLHLLRVAKV